MKTQIITIAHQKGGVGKTTIAINVQAEMQNALLIDLDSHQGLTVLNKLRPDDYKKLDVASIEDENHLEALVKNYAGQTILVDQGGFDSNYNRLVLSIADLIIIPCNQSPLEIMSLFRFDEILSEINNATGQTKKAHVLPCRHHVNKTQFDDFERSIAKSHNLILMKSRVPMRKDYMTSSECGLSVLEYPKSSEKSRGEVKNLCNEIKELLVRI